MVKKIVQTAILGEQKFQRPCVASSGLGLRTGPDAPCPMLAPPLPTLPTQTTWSGESSLLLGPMTSPQGGAPGCWLALTKGPWKGLNQTRKTGRVKVMGFKRRRAELVSSWVTLSDRRQESKEMNWHLWLSHPPYLLHYSALKPHCQL